MREAHEELREKLHVHGLLAAETFEDLVRLEAPHHRADVLFRQRRHPDGRILVNLDADAAYPQEYDGAELAVVRGAHDELDARERLVDENALEAVDPAQGTIGVPELLVARDSRDDAADLGLVERARRDDLRDDRVTDSPGAPPRSPQRQ